MRSRLFAMLAAALVLAGSAAGQSVDPFVPPAGAEAARVAPAPPLRLADDPGAAPIARLAPATEAAADRLAALHAWNASGRLPQRIGIHRELPLVEPIAVLGERRADAAALPGRAARTPAGTAVWGGEVRVADAARLRLHLTDLDLPPGTRMWVWGSEEGPIGPFGLELAAEGGMWSPSVDGPAIRLEIEVPAGAARAVFRIDRVAEILAGGAPPAAGESAAAAPLVTDCLADANCFGPAQFPAIELVRKAVAHLQFDSGEPGFVDVCSGALLNDVGSTGTPFLLTAHHCFSSQAKAATLEAFWDYTTIACGAGPTSLGTRPRSNGSTVLATGVASDFTLVRLGSVPGGRAFLGWTANPSDVTPGATLHRVHHPVPETTIFPQSYTAQRFLGAAFGQQCQGTNDPSQFHHGELVDGGTFGGSSGAPLMLGNGQVVGQLLGACGPNPTEGCDAANEEIDGAFSASFPSLAPFLAPSEGDDSPCVPGLGTICLNNGRHEVEITFLTPQGAFGQGGVAPAGSVNSGIFYFFNPNNWEMLIKILNGCPVNGRWWIFFAATTNVQFTVTVRDTLTGTTKSYFNPLGQAAEPVQDTAAFATCP